MPSGIQPMFEVFYIEAMIWHTASAGQSIEEVGEWLALVDADDERSLEFPKAELFERLHNILHQAGCISRYLFPSRSRALHTERAACLREALAVKDDNALADRGLRDGLEHFDERLDRYLDEHHVGQFIPEYVGYEMPAFEVPPHIFKGFYTSTLTFVLLGVSYRMEPIVDELLRLHNLLVTWSESGGRLPRS